jgi:hypothetical protein
MAIGLQAIPRYAGIGIATPTLIDSTVRATIRHSDSEPIASEAATASVSLDETIGAERIWKPAAPGDRLMAGILQGAGESPAARGILQGSPAILRRQNPRTWRNNGGLYGYARYLGCLACAIRKSGRRFSEKTMLKRKI